MCWDAGHEFNRMELFNFTCRRSFYRTCVSEKEVEADPGFNLHRPVLQTLPLAALTDDDFIISDGKSSHPRKSIRVYVDGAAATNMNKHFFTFWSTKTLCSGLKCMF